MTAINHLFCAVYVLDKEFVSEGFLLNQIHFAIENHFKGIAEIEEILHIVPLFVISGVKIHKQVHIAFVVESIAEDRAKDCKRLHAVFAA